MKQLLIILLLCMLVMTEACKKTTTNTPATPAAVTNQVLTPQDYAAMYTAKMKGMRKWAIRFTSSYPSQPPTDTTIYNNMREVVVINDTTIYFNRDTLLFAPKSIVIQGFTIKTDTSSKLSYYSPNYDSYASTATFLTYYYKEDSITYSTRKYYLGGGSGSYWHTHK